MEGIKLSLPLIHKGCFIMNNSNANTQKVVPLRSERSSQPNKVENHPNDGGCKVEVVQIGKLTFTIYTNIPSPEAITSFNDCFSKIFERSISNEQSNALPA